MSRTLSQEVTTMPAPSAHIRFRKRTGALRSALILLLLVAATAATSSAQTFKAVYNFCSKKNPAGYCLDGQNPWSTLVQGTNGDLYGTTFAGGSNNGNYGTIFKITPAGKLKTIYNFCSLAGCADGTQPQGGLLLAANGTFYGITNSGGAYGYGTVFKMTAAGALTTLHSFNQTDGAYPQAGLIQATDGNFYGTTYVGGAYSAGTAFEITSTGTLTTLHNFCGGLCSDGNGLTSGLIQATDGNFYGTAYGGGPPGGCYPLSGGGTFFQMNSSGTLTPLALFCEPYGFYPNSTLVQAANGNFYGTTAGGGSGNNGDGGTVYEVTPTGSLTSLYSFCLQTGCPDGYFPLSLILGTDGNFYGTTNYGGTNNDGTLFEITSTGQLTTLHSFTGTDGLNPFGALLLNTNGTFYGTSYLGGTHGGGVIYSLATGLGAFVETIPTSGAAKTKVTILGTNLTGATAVSFNGTAATFKVVSASEIKTAVPVGATSGTVTVTTSGGATLNSNVAFQVP